MDLDELLDEIKPISKQNIKQSKAVNSDWDMAPPLQKKVSNWDDDEEDSNKSQPQ